MNFHFSRLDMQQAGVFWTHSPTVLSEKRLVTQTRAPCCPHTEDKVNAVKRCGELFQSLGELLKKVDTMSEGMVDVHVECRCIIICIREISPLFWFYVA